MIRRQRDILERLSKTSDVYVNELAEEFNVSRLTIRRDLDALSEAGKLVRTRGGATSGTLGEIRFLHNEKAREHMIEKEAIARAVAETIEPGMAISLDTGTTTMEVARAIRQIPNLTVLTSSLAVASVLYGHENITLNLLGGQVGIGSPDLTGEITESNITRFRVHKTILGADAVSEDGLFTANSAVARVSRAMIDGGDERILVIDSSKLDSTAFVRIAPLSEIHCIVTDENATPAQRRWLDTHVKRVIYAPLPGNEGNREENNPPHSRILHKANSV